MLHNIGIKNRILFQICQLLTNREVMVQLEGCTSEAREVTNGLAQGNPSSVVLADIYGSTIASSMDQKHGRTMIKVCFVDDITLLISVENSVEGVIEVQNVLNSIYEDAKKTRPKTT